jgi:hypothetical protein
MIESSIPPAALSFTSTGAVLHNVSVRNATLSFHRGKIMIVLRDPRREVDVRIGRAALHESDNLAELPPRRRAKGKRRPELLFRVAVRLASARGAVTDVVVAVPEY